MAEAKWQDIGPVAELQKQGLQQLSVGRTKIALSLDRGVEMARLLLGTGHGVEHTERGGRKAYRMAEAEAAAEA